MQITRLELLAPARNADIGIAAIDCGADAVYIAGPAFGARAAAGNAVEDIDRLCHYAHRYGAKVHATVNTLLTAEEGPQALALMQQQGLTEKTIYSDSYNAILWVNKRQCKTKLERTPETEPLFQIIQRAERWLQTHTWRNPIVKWETKQWGEVPADFGRK